MIKMKFQRNYPNFYKPNLQLLPIRFFNGNCYRCIMVDIILHKHFIIFKLFNSCYVLLKKTNEESIVCICQMVVRHPIRTFIAKSFPCSLVLIYYSLCLFRSSFFLSLCRCVGFCLTGTTRGFLGLDRGITIFLGFISKLFKISAKLLNLKYFQIITK